MGTCADFMLGGRWHSGAGTVSYSSPTKMPGCFPWVDYDGKVGNDAIPIGSGLVDEPAPLDTTILRTSAQPAAAVRAAHDIRRREHAHRIRSRGADGGAPMTGIQFDWDDRRFGFGG